MAFLADKNPDKNLKIESLCHASSDFCVMEAW